jgi:broad specificity phosphatase PhoE
MVRTQPVQLHLALTNSYTCWHGQLEQLCERQRQCMAAVPRQTRRSCIMAARQSRQSETASAIAAAVQQACNFDELQRLIELLPVRFQDSLQRQPHLHDLIEIVLDLGRQPVARFPQSYVALSGDNVSEEDIETAVSKVMPSVAECACLKPRACSCQPLITELGTRR